LGPLLGLALVYLFFVAVGPEAFATTRTLETIARQTAIVGTAALGMTMIIIAGGIDLSVGSIVALSSVVVALALNGGSGSLAAIAAAAAAGAFCGLVNGTLITRLRVAPFIVTLGMLLLVRGAAKGLGKEQKVDAPMTWLVDLLSSLPPDRKWMVVPSGVWFLAMLAVLTAFVLRYTKLGAHLFAIGSNEETARLCGVAVERVKVIVYTLSGALAGLTGVLQFSRLTVGDPTVAVGLELDVIAAVVIGGGSLSGGEGTVLGTLVGAFIMTVIRTGTAQMGLPNWVQEIVTGVIIVAAVAIDRWRHRRMDE
jgi:ribose/xylose/arabinose/galactoside ABC-type transport system permease subunit